MWIVLLALLLAASASGAILLFQMACSRTGGPLGRLLPALLHSEGNPVDLYADVIEAGKKWYEDQKKEDIRIKSRDGLNLHGVFIENPDAKRVILCVHGYHGGAVRDFSGAMADLYAEGCSLLLIDQRAHGKSEGKYTTFGVHERYDVQKWAEYLEKRLDGSLPVFFDGISMGAATVLMAGELEMPSCVRGVIADCGYTTPRAQLSHVVRNMLHAAPFPALQVVLLLSRFCGFPLSSVSATKGAAAWRVPVLFAHGLDDTFVPSYMSEENFLACTSPKDIYLVEGAEHGLSYLVDREGYLTKLRNLFRAAENQA